MRRMKMIILLFLISLTVTLRDVMALAEGVPATGDKTHLPVYIAMMSCAGLGMILLLIKWRQKAK